MAQWRLGQWWVPQWRVAERWVPPRLYELERSRIEQERSQDRKNKIGTGDRSERIRTYNFPQGRVTDHRINLTLHKLEEFLEGEIFDEMIDNLSLKSQEESLKTLN